MTSYFELAQLLTGISGAGVVLSGAMVVCSITALIAGEDEGEEE